MKTEHINIGTIYTLLAGTAGAIVWLFTQFASAEDMSELKNDVNERLSSVEISIAYGQFYDRLDDRDEADDEGNESLAKEYERQMERLRAKICEDDPEWERCDD